MNMNVPYNYKAGVFQANEIVKQSECQDEYNKV